MTKRLPGSLMLVVEHLGINHRGSYFHSGGLKIGKVPLERQSGLKYKYKYTRPNAMFSTFIGIPKELPLRM